MTKRSHNSPRATELPFNTSIHCWNSQCISHHKTQFWIPTIILMPPVKNGDCISHERAWDIAIIFIWSFFQGYWLKHLFPFIILIIDCWIQSLVRYGRQGRPDFIVLIVSDKPISASTWICIGSVVGAICTEIRSIE